MKKNTFGIASSALSGLLVAVLFACNTPVSTIQPNSVDNKLSAASSVKMDLQAHPYSLQGKLQFANKGFGVKAKFEDYLGNSTVTLYRANGTTVVAGSPASVDANGNFVFVPSAGFTPNVGEVFVLQANLKAGTNMNSAPDLNLKTLIRWNGSGYDSITGGVIYINTYTTALAIMAAQGDVTQVATINSISVSNGISTPTTIAPMGTNHGASATEINNTAKVVTQSVQFQADPANNITGSNGTYMLSSGTFNPTSGITASNSVNGTQKDRLAIPSLNIVINGYNGFTGAVYDSLSMTKAMRNTAKDTSNTESPDTDINNYRTFWGVAIHAVFPDTTTQAYADAISGALTPDVQTLDMSMPTSFSYAPIANPNANSATEIKGNPTLNGRMLKDDVVDVELKTLSNVAGATDGVAYGQDGKTDTTTFPYLSSPW